MSTITITSGNGTVTVPANAISMTMTIFGGGGGGGFNSVAFASLQTGGGGGGQGGGATVTIPVIPATIISYTIGAGGSGAVTDQLGTLLSNATNGVATTVTYANISYTATGGSAAYGVNGGQGGIFINGTSTGGENGQYGKNGSGGNGGGPGGGYGGSSGYSGDSGSGIYGGGGGGAGFTDPEAGNSGNGGNGASGSFIYTFTIQVPCFLEGTQILCFQNGTEQYLPIQDLKNGTLVKTLKNGYIPINMIGTSQIYNSEDDTDPLYKLYTYSKEQYPELLNDLVITGGHSILVDSLTQEQHAKLIDLYGEVWFTDDKYRLLTIVNENAKKYNEQGFFNIWHLCLSNDDYYGNYGIYANGLLVESCSEAYMEKFMNIIE
ncbi:hint domain protein [Indivirus ILV1]|uniref:Hint domain protein n=1 Tax=Indivirus ILV1 TaxID=1977633 RepID=A0A1V0SDW8_9VIRU|nr:hint domain protein [Indivirus ILV1]